MQLIRQLYRKDYQGEDVVTELQHVNHRWLITTEYIPNQIANLQTSNRALIIGNGDSRSGFDLNLAKRNQAGLLGRNKLQTYGCNALYRDFTPDFLVVTGKEFINEILTTNYTDEHVVYANAWAIDKFPKKFYLIPQDPAWNSGSIAAYLACFDGHKKVYLLGFDGNDSDQYNNNIYNDTIGYPSRLQPVNESFYVESMLQVFQTYPDVDFVRLSPSGNYRMPEKWRYQTNVRQISFRDFVYEADL